MAGWAASSKRQLLLLAAVVVALSLLASPSASAHRRLPVRLRLYMHDIVGGPGQTAVLLVKGTGPENPSMYPGNNFGDTVAVDDALTAGVGADSAAVGRAQGTYMTASLRRPVFVVSVTLRLDAPPRFNGSTLVVAGRDDTSEPARELAVVGGTGALRGARGHVLWSTARVVSPLYAVLLLDVHASVPANKTAAATPASDDASSLLTSADA